VCDWQREWTELTNPDGGSTVPIRRVEPIEYGETLPGITCPECGGELVLTSNGAFCDECSALVPVVGNAVHVNDDADDESDWIEEE
jgi:hypothetical protein